MDVGHRSIVMAPVAKMTMRWHFLPFSGSPPREGAARINACSAAGLPNRRFPRRKNWPAGQLMMWPKPPIPHGALDDPIRITGHVRSPAARDDAKARPKSGERRSGRMALRRWVQRGEGAGSIRTVHSFD